MIDGGAGTAYVERMRGFGLTWLLLVAQACACHSKTMPMDEHRFWKLIESTGSPNDPRVKEEALRAALLPLSREDVVAFDRIYHEKMRRAYSWDLWAAGFIVGHGCSDDGFTEFRNYVIGHGREFYEAAVRDPDGMASTLGTVREMKGMPLPYLPESDMIPSAVLEGRGEEPGPFEMSGGRTPAGTPWRESRADLSARCPKLWKRFGGDWIEVFERR